MGNLLSFKSKNPKRSTIESEERVSDDSNNITISSDYEFDQVVIKKLIRDFKKNTDTFIINHVIMSIMFFEDYDRDTTTYKKNENNVSPTLLKEYQKGCLQLDTIPDIINEYIKFKPHHGRKKDVYESLLTKRIYVMYDNFEIITKEDEDYCLIDKPRYRAKLINTSKKGYVRLKYIPEDFKGRSSNSTSDSADSKSSSESQDESEDEDYGRVNDLRTLKDLNMYDFCDSIPFPENFILEVKVRNEGEREDQAVEESYLNSEVIMKHFQSKTVQHPLLKSLEFKEDDIDKAQCTSSSIFISNLKNDCFINWEVVPAVNILWPVEQAIEWYTRSDRKTIKRDNLVCKWPTSRMLDVITKLDCAVIPRGYMPKHGENKKQKLEWEISFPRVEKYLETKLKHCHIKPYLIIAALFKTFIEPKTEKKGVLMEHFRNQLYWEVETNVLDWYDDILGKNVLKMLKNFYNKLSHANLSDYFIREKNVFENIPSPLLRIAQDQIHEILESPVMHFIAALRNIRYIKSDYYPEPDFKKLYTILTKSGLKNTNPEILNNPIRDVYDRRSNMNRDNRVGKKKYKKKSEKKKVVIVETPVDEKTEKKVSKDSLDFEWISLHVKEDEGDYLFKEIHIVTFFLDHFIEIAKTCIKLKAINQAKFYVKRCYYLQQVLLTLNTENEDTKQYDKKIKQLQKDIHINNESPPDPPARNSFFVPKIFGSNSTLSEPGRISLRPTSEALTRKSEGGLSNLPQRPASLHLTDAIIPTEVISSPKSKTFIELQLEK